MLAGQAIALMAILKEELCAFPSEIAAWPSRAMAFRSNVREEVLAILATNALLAARLPSNHLLKHMPSFYHGAMQLRTPKAICLTFDVA